MNRTITISDSNFNIIPLSENYIPRHEHSFASFAGSAELHTELYYLTGYTCNRSFKSDIHSLYNSLLLPYNSLLHEYTHMMHEHNRMVHEHNRMLHEHNCMMYEHNRMIHEHNRMIHEHNRMLNFFNKAFLSAKSKCSDYSEKLSILLNDNVLNTAKLTFRFILQWKLNPSVFSKPDLSPVIYYFSYLQRKCNIYLHIVFSYKFYIGGSINIV